MVCVLRMSKLHNCNDCQNSHPAEARSENALRFPLLSWTFPSATFPGFDCLNRRFSKIEFPRAKKGVRNGKSRATFTLLGIGVLMTIASLWNRAIQRLQMVALEEMLPSYSAVSFAYARVLMCLYWCLSSTSHHLFASRGPGTSLGIGTLPSELNAWPILCGALGSVRLPAKEWPPECWKGCWTNMVQNGQDDDFGQAHDLFLNRILAFTKPKWNGAPFCSRDFVQWVRQPYCDHSWSASHEIARSEIRAQRHRHQIASTSVKTERKKSQRKLQCFEPPRKR